MSLIFLHWSDVGEWVWINSQFFSFSLIPDSLLPTIVKNDDFTNIFEENANVPVSRYYHNCYGLLLEPEHNETRLVHDWNFHQNRTKQVSCSR